MGSIIPQINFDQVGVGAVPLPGSTGNVSVTGVGFQPKLVEFRHWHTYAATDHWRITGIGRADENLKQFISVVSEKADTSGLNAGFTEFGIIAQNDRCIDLNDGSSHIAEISSMDSDGFTLNFTSAGSSFSFIAFTAMR